MGREAGQKEEYLPILKQVERDSIVLVLIEVISRTSVLPRSPAAPPTRQFSLPNGAYLALDPTARSSKAVEAPPILHNTLSGQRAHIWITFPPFGHL